MKHFGEKGSFQKSKFNIKNRNFRKKLKKYQGFG